MSGPRRTTARPGAGRKAATARRGTGPEPRAPSGATPKGRRPASTPSPPPDGTRERILAAAETVLRRHGAAKLTVMDIARALGMSHANIYRHFPSRTALQDALVDRWLQQVAVPLREIAARPDPASERLEAWLLALIAAKRRKVLRDPELFEAYHAASEATRTVVDEHRRDMHRLLVSIVRDGASSGEFTVRNVEAAVTAIRDATARFVDPHYIRQTAGSGARKHGQDAKRVLKLVIAGLRSGAV